MLILTGTIGGKTYDKTNISANDFAKLVGVDKFLTNRRQVCVKIVEGGGINSDGQKLIPTGEAVPAEWTGVYQGNSITLRYARREQSIVVGESVKKEYEPRKLRYDSIHLFFSLAESVGIVKDKEELVFLLSHPNNSKSPLFQVGARVIFETQDPDAKAAQEKEINDLFDRLYQKIQKMSADRVRFLAIGLHISTAEESADGCRNAVIGKLFEAKFNNRLKLFSQELDEDMNMVLGSIVELRSSGLLSLEVESGGQKWMGRDAENRYSIFICNTNIDDPTPERSLALNILSNEHVQTKFSQLQERRKNATMKYAPNTSQFLQKLAGEDKTTSTPNLAYIEDYLNNGRLRLVEKNIIFDDQVIGAAKSAKTWKEEALDLLTSKTK